MRWFLTALALVLPIAVSVSASAADPVVTNPKWLKKPSEADLERFWPAGARGMSGLAKIQCIVTSRGLLDKCEVVEETPPEHGFGGAALLLAPLFVMQPRMVDGVPVSGAGVIIPIRFKLEGAGTMDGPQTRVANNLPWRAVPSAADMAAAFPAQAAGHEASGHVVLRCRMAGDGGLKGCEVATEEPRGEGFGQAARNLAKAFRVADEVVQSKPMQGVYVDVPFDFRDPRRPGPSVEVNDPEWQRGADPVMAGKLFPEAAAKAGLKTGRAIVDCEAAHDGTLIHCAVVSEEPSGLGFGESALAIAGVMQMNPWTKQGAPVEGAKIRLPIRLNLSAAQQTPPP
jgi:hypothetical protein